MEVVKGFGRLFYMVSPSETAVERLEDLPHPDYVNKAVPYFITLILLEYAVQVYKNKRRTRLNDAVVSLSHGMYLGCQELLFKGVEHYAYIKIYENWRIVELPWDSAWTWYFTLLGVDLGYYWVHRACHEVQFFWAQHQVHHSSEDYNLTTALRQAGFQGWVGWMFYLPLAFFVPSPIFLIHAQFNLLFQFWIHTEVIESLGPLEWILNTPRHHRIHHGKYARSSLLFFPTIINATVVLMLLSARWHSGTYKPIVLWSLLWPHFYATTSRVDDDVEEFCSNRYCLDKNYAGVLIIWDRIFGTFAEEKPGEKIVYGLVEEVKSFNPFWLQIFYYPKIWNRMKEYESWKDKISVALNGPGWAGPGSPRLGNINDVPEVPDREVYDVPLPTWKNIYAGSHFFILISIFHVLSTNELLFNQSTVISVVGFLLFSLTSIGFVLEDRTIGGMTEICRSCLVILYVFLSPGIGPLLRLVIHGIYGLSIGLWSIQLAMSKDESSKTSHLYKNGIQNDLSNKKAD